MKSMHKYKGKGDRGYYGGAQTSKPANNHRKQTSGGPSPKNNVNTIHSPTKSESV